MAIENRGFASMSDKKRREIAAMGGRASRGGGRKAKTETARVDETNQKASPESK